VRAAVVEDRLDSGTPRGYAERRRGNPETRVEIGDFFLRSWRVSGGSPFYKNRRPPPANVSARSIRWNCNPRNMPESYDHAIHWRNATMQWTPGSNWSTATLRIPTWIDGYAALILGQELSGALTEIATGEGRLDVRIEPTTRLHGERSGVRAEPGEIVIIADDLTERLSPHELRRTIGERASAAMIEGDHLAERDEKRARAFLDALA